MYVHTLNCKYKLYQHLRRQPAPVCTAEFLRRFFIRQLYLDQERNDKVRDGPKGNKRRTKKRKIFDGSWQGDGAYHDGSEEDREEAKALEERRDYVQNGGTR